MKKFSINHFDILTFKIDLKFQIYNLKFIKYLYFIF